MRQVRKAGRGREGRKGGETASDRTSSTAIDSAHEWKDVLTKLETRVPKGDKAD